MKINDFEKAKPLIGRLARLKKNKDELECSLIETESAGKSLGLSLRYAGCKEIKIIGEDIDTREIIQGIIWEIEAKIIEISNELEAI